MPEDVAKQSGLRTKDNTGSAKQEKSAGFKEKNDTQEHSATSAKLSSEECIERQQSSTMRQK